MAKFMLILHQTPGVWRNLSPEEMQRKIEKYQAWAAKIRSSGRHVSSEKLGEEGGKLLSLNQGHLHIVDGPYSEAKEVVGGYFLFRAADYEEALEFVRDCPFLEDGRISLRQTDPMGCGGD
ncbi:MAG TPA: YciI family protein [Gemmataceae bacterium]|nr:YciI family protein [Gemmataceae bacterium]